MSPHWMPSVQLLLSEVFLSPKLTNWMVIWQKKTVNRFWKWTASLNIKSHSIAPFVSLSDKDLNQWKKSSWFQVAQWYRPGQASQRPVRDQQHSTGLSLPADALTQSEWRSEWRSGLSEVSVALKDTVRRALVCDVGSKPGASTHGSLSNPNDVIRWMKGEIWGCVFLFFPF